MPTRFQVCAWIAVVALATPAAGVAQERTAREIIDLIVREGPQARAIRAGAEVVRHEQLARLAYPNPGMSYSREGAGFTEFLEVEQYLPIFGTRGALSRAGVEATEAAAAERDARLWLLRTEAAVAVARLAASQARATATGQLVQDLQGLIAILRTREREGEGSRFDRLRAEQEWRDARLLATSAAADAAAARGSLASLLPADVVLGPVLVDVDARREARPTDALIEQAQGTRAELRALAHSAERATFESDAARRARLPAPTLFGGFKRADVEDGRESGGVFGVRVTLPLFDRGGREEAQWNAERARVEAETASVRRRIEAEIARAAEILALRQSALAADEEAAGAELTDIAAVAYREGAVGILELLDAIRTAARARNRSIDLRLEARLAQIALEGAVGDVLWP